MGNLDVTSSTRQLNESNIRWLENEILTSLVYLIYLQQTLWTYKPNNNIIV